MYEDWAYGHHPSLTTPHDCSKVGTSYLKLTIPFACFAFLFKNRTAPCCDRCEYGLFTASTPGVRVRSVVCSSLLLQNNTRNIFSNVVLKMAHIMILFLTKFFQWPFLLKWFWDGYLPFMEECLIIYVRDIGVPMKMSSFRPLLPSKIVIPTLTHVIKGF